MRLIDLNPRPQTFKNEVLLGLSRRPKRIPPKFLYDEAGSMLFEEICELEEYYLTRAELAILDRCIDEIAGALGPDCWLMELGSGAGVKTRLLLEHLEKPAAYAPIDISKEMLLKTARELEREFPELEIVPVLGDFTRRLDLKEDGLIQARSRAAFFPGSTVGNFDPNEAVVLLAGLRSQLGDKGLVVVGVDFVKDRRVLEAAYDDKSEVTARFNLNLLARINREIGASFDLSCFRHVAFYNSRESRVEMHLESLRTQEVFVHGQRFLFEKGETLHTECSYKYSPGRFEDLAGCAGFRKLRLWTDEKEWFGVYLLEVAS